MLRIQLLGGFQLHLDDEAVTTVTVPRLQLLLAYLALHGEAPQARRHLAFLFWPDSTEAQARTNLRRALHDLRQAFPTVDHYITLTTQWLQWRPDAPYTLDVRDFEKAFAVAAELEQNGQSDRAVDAFTRAAQLYQGDFLPGAYDDWVLERRAKLGQQVAHALERLTELHELRQAYADAIGYGQRLLRHDPLAETTYQRLMRLHALKGDRAGALRVYHACVAVLARELAVEPSPETRAAYAQLLNPAAQVAAPATVPAHHADSPALAGRQSEWQLLLAVWRRTRQGLAHVVAITGEAGIGKSRLAETLCDWARRQGFRVAHARAFDIEGGFAYAPLIELLRADALAAGLSSLSDIWLAPIARLLPELLDRHPHLAQAQPLAEPLQRQQFYEALARAVLGDRQPLLLALDDMQWCDGETLAWLHYLLHFAPNAPLLIVLTVRTGAIPAEHPLHNFIHNLHRDSRLTEINLPRMTQTETATLAAQIAGRVLAEDHLAELFRQTEGNPFFVVELLRVDATNWIAGRENEPDADAASPTPLRILRASQASLPDRVQAVIQAHLAQLTPLAQDVARLAAVIGRSFSFPVLAQAGSYSENELVQSLDELWQRHILREQGAHEYDFSHPLMRDFAYGQLSAIRRRMLHRRVARALEIVHEHELDAVSGLIAAHHEGAGEIEQSIHAYQRAARFAKQAFAYSESAELLSKAIALLEDLPTPEAHQRQLLELYLDLGWALMMAKGWANQEAQQAYSRALALCRAIEQEGELAGPDSAMDAQVFEAVWGLHEIYLFQLKLKPAHEASNLCWHLAQSSDDPEILLQAHHALWGVYFFFSMTPDSLQRTVEHAEQGIKLYSTDWHQRHVLRYGGHDPAVCAISMKAKAQCLLGYPDQALETMDEAVALARQLDHLFSLRMCLMQAAKLHYYRDEPQHVFEWCEQAKQLPTDEFSQGHTAEVTLMRAWAQCRLGYTEEALVDIQEAWVQRQAQEGPLELPFFLTQVADAYLHAGRLAAASQAIQEAEAHAAATHPDHLHAEIFRVHGCVLWAGGDAEAAERNFRHACEIAQTQSAKWLELRAALNLSQLWVAQNRRTDALALLAPIYNWFTEGFDTVDLRAARDLLLTLASD